MHLGVGLETQRVRAVMREAFQQREQLTNSTTFVPQRRTRQENLYHKGLKLINQPSRLSLSMHLGIVVRLETERVRAILREGQGSGFRDVHGRERVILREGSGFRVQRVRAIPGEASGFRA